jgi:6-phosphogluconolactonase
MLLLVGTYTEPILFGTGKVLQGKGEGIYVYRLDESSGALHAVGHTSGIANPSHLALDESGAFVYAVNELKTYEGRPTGTVSAFAFDPRSGALRFLNKQLTHGTDPCHVAVDAERRYVFVANYMSGSVCVLPVRDDGSLGPASDFVQHVGSSIDPKRQAGPHAHAVILDPSNAFVFVPDLGLDKLMVYRFDPRRGMLEPSAAPPVKTTPGAGPRHLAFHPEGRFAYLVNELDSTIAALAYDAYTGRFDYIDAVSTLPDGFTGPSTCADIHVAPSGRFVYASNRGHDTIAILAVDAASGRLRPDAHQSTQGNTPRCFAMDPSGRFLIVANQDSDNLVAFRVDPESGALRRTSEIAAPTPVCVKFV